MLCLLPTGCVLLRKSIFPASCCKQEGFPAGFCKTIVLQGKRISLRSKTVPQRWVVGFCPKQNVAGMGVEGHLHRDGSKETAVGSDGAGVGSCLAGSREAVDQHRKEKSMLSWMLPKGQLDRVVRSAIPDKQYLERSQ